jgi:SulP family sulfate permease
MEVPRQPRSATIQAEVVSDLYVLRADAFNTITPPTRSSAKTADLLHVGDVRLAFSSRG